MHYQPDIQLSRWAKAIVVIVLLVICVACQKYDLPILMNATPEITQTQTASATVLYSPSLPDSISQYDVASSQLPYDTRLVDIRSVNASIALDIRYATENNFLKRKLYPVARCVLRGAAAKKLSQVQADLAKKGLGLKVYDCYRPLSVQKQMWKVLPDSRYVANPATGSRHNRGAAVDVTLVDRKGKELEMPTGFDDFSERAHRGYKGASAQAKKNRALLEDVMKKYGFTPLFTEWWHFDAPGWEKFVVLDVPFGAIPYSPKESAFLTYFLQTVRVRVSFPYPYRYFSFHRKE